MILKNIVHNESYIKEKEFSISNNIINHLDIDIIGHFGNTVCLEIICNDIIPYSCYNNTKNIGFIIQGIVELLDLSNEDGIRISEIKNIPIRLVFDNNKAVGIGHFMKDKFVMFSELSKLDVRK